MFHTKNVCADLGEHKKYILWFRLIINVFHNSLSVVPYLDDADLQLKIFYKVCLSIVCGYLGFSFARWSITLLITYFFVRLFTFYQIILTFDVFKPSTWLLSVLQIAWRSLPQQPCNLQMTKPHQGHLSNIFLCTPTRLKKPSTTALQPPDDKATSRAFSQHFLRTFSRLKKSSTTALQPLDDKATSRALQLSLPICVQICE